MPLTKADSHNKPTARALEVKATALSVIMPANNVEKTKPRKTWGPPEEGC
ncbi:hypothetical protein TUM17580_21430 [Citrobacter farmeri]|nr:hypothetical protein TUM17580_21430 [Citrobacter farmeri]